MAREKGTNSSAKCFVHISCWAFTVSLWGRCYYPASLTDKLRLREAVEHTHSQEGARGWLGGTLIMATHLCLYWALLCAYYATWDKLPNVFSPYSQALYDKNSGDIISKSTQLISNRAKIQSQCAQIWFLCVHPYLAAFSELIVHKFKYWAQWSIQSWIRESWPLRSFESN